MKDAKVVDAFDQGGRAYLITGMLVGATLHHALTKTDPRLYAPFSFDERPMCDFNSDVPEVLEDIVLRATHPLTRERYPNCDALKAALSIV